MQTKLNSKEKINIFSKNYWFDATNQLKNVNMITIAALIVALRVAVKFIKITLAPGLNISLDAYVNSLGSIIYGPIVGLFVGIVVRNVIHIRVRPKRLLSEAAEPPLVGGNRLWKATYFFFL